MHQKKSDLQIGEEGRRRRISSDFDPTPPVLSPPKYLQIPALPPKSQQNQLQTLFRHESICSIPSTSQTLLSTPHKRPIMSQNPSSLSHSASLSSLQQTHNFDSNSLSFSSFTSFSTIPFASRSLAIKLIRHLRRARVQFRFLLLLSLPFFYFFVSSPRRSFILNFLSILAFAIALLVSLNLGFARLPSVSLLLKRSLPIKFPSSSAPSKPFQTVLWSIGSNPKSEQKPNSGSWVHVYSNGDIYEGEFHEGKCSGSGVYYYYMSGRYEGDWIDEKYDGYGVETWARGSRYRGQYRQGLRHGVGVYRFYTGDVYAGEWSKGQSHGCGVHTCEDGSKYVGEFKWGVKHGLGYYHFRNGDTYAGEYFADKIHGFGVYRFGNGHRYEGGWHEGRRQGLGTYTFRNGETQSGHWQNGVLNVPRTQNNDPESPYAAKHSKVLNAVQEARRAAEKAYNMEKVDERVNRAVAAANKAANAARVAAIKAVQNRMHNSNNEYTTARAGPAMV